ncbi:ureidoglycolate lyase [Lyngbya confervoides]|uniref:Ureidoglycolate lyase n=1 Tax=Lyngbya confervoides BDU141951 TaxID=1574623 RepID=A0ABD4SYD7_9CYAN|nr:ureidoglycolate lyase [Lyngbya confervoides]MCM1981298.1 ureidoglycolate lyase [Lyngbya confervoides BDU141951]
MSCPVPLRSLPAQTITVENFRPYGQFILPQEDGTPFGEGDAQIYLGQGPPRFYLMHLEYRGRQFHTITHHRHCTQCLGSLEGRDWFIAVAPAAPTPSLAQLQAFHIPGIGFIKLDRGTWHAGPYFDHPAVNFYNLEMIDTNVVDHSTYDFLAEQGLCFEIHPG